MCGTQLGVERRSWPTPQISRVGAIDSLRSFTSVRFMEGLRMPAVFIRLWRGTADLKWHVDR